MSLLNAFLLALLLMGLVIFLSVILNVAIERFPKITLIVCLIILVALITMGIYLG